MKRGREEEPELEDECEALTMTGQGNLCERRMMRDAAGVGGSVAGSASVCVGMGECVAWSSTVRAEGVNVTSYVFLYV